VDPLPDMTTKLLCSELGRSPAQLAGDWLRGWHIPDLPQWQGREVVFTQSGRSAILLAARLWGLDDKHEVLVPAYNCGSEISPVISTGARVSMYRVDSGARIDVEDLLRRVTPRTKMVYVTHYFGRAADLDEVVKFCRERNIKVLEDCALSLFSGETGRSGDAAIFSFRKSLPAVVGGALVLRDVVSTKNYVTKYPSAATTARSALSLVRKWSQTSNEFHPVAHRKDGQPPDLPASYYCPSNTPVRRGSRFIPGLLRETDSQKIIRQRRQNYAQLRKCLTDTPGLRFLWQEETFLPENMCPLGLPLLVRDKGSWCKRLNAAGIAVSPWWAGHHRGLDWGEFPEALLLKAQLILLPIHQGLTARHMEFVAATVRSLATE
jgi:perosamine synthetase